MKDEDILLVCPHCKSKTLDVTYHWIDGYKYLGCDTCNSTFASFDEDVKKLNPEYNGLQGDYRK